MSLLGRGVFLARDIWLIGREREDVGGAFFVAEGFVHAGDRGIADQANGDLGAIQPELLAHASEECFEWGPRDADGSLAV